MRLKWIIATSLAAVSLVFASGVGWTAGQYGPGASDTEIKIGNTMPYSGPASSYGVIGKSEANRRPRSLSSRHDPWAYVRNVCFWHKADISRLSSNVRFWG